MPIFTVFFKAKKLPNYKTMDCQAQERFLVKFICMPMWNYLMCIMFVSLWVKRVISKFGRTIPKYIFNAFFPKITIVALEWERYDQLS